MSDFRLFAVSSIMKRFVSIVGFLVIFGVGVSGSALANAVSVYNASEGLVGMPGIDASGV